MQARETKHQQAECGDLAEAHGEQLTAGDGINPLVPATLRERLIDDALLKEVQLARCRIGFLFDGRQEQRVKFRMAFLDLPADGAVVRLPVAPTSQNDKCSKHAAAHENRNEQGQGTAQDRARGEQEEGD